MTSSASSLLLGALIPASALAQTADESVLPPGLESRVQNTIGESWSVPAEHIYLSWGIIRDAATLDANSAFRLVGSGDDGWYAVLFERPDLPAIAARVRAGVTRSVPVAAHAMTTGTELTADDFTTDTKVTWGPPAADHPEGPGVGWIVRTPVAAGDVMYPPRVSPPPVVREGEHVKVQWKKGLVSVMIDGIALSDGAVGERVNIRLSGRRGRVRATATGTGTAAFEGR